MKKLSSALFLMLNALLIGCAPLGSVPLGTGYQPWQNDDYTPKYRSEEQKALDRVLDNYHAYQNDHPEVKPIPQFQMHPDFRH